MWYVLRGNYKSSYKETITMNEKRTHLISCPSAHMEPERIHAASDRSIDITYAVHIVLRHSGDRTLELIARQV